jgi:hypothetical protein
MNYFHAAKDYLVSPVQNAPLLCVIALIFKQVTTLGMPIKVFRCHGNGSEEISAWRQMLA